MEDQKQATESLGFTRLNRGKLIVIEGLDKSGKETQSSMLVAHINKNTSFNAERMVFPNYSSMSGTLIRDYLDGKQQFSQKTINMIYSVNRYEQRDFINQWLNAGTILVLDRYYFSNMCYGSFDGQAMGEIEAMDSEMPKPDCVLYIDISPEISQQRNSNQDINERNLEFLRHVRQNYLDLAKRYNWIVIEGEMDKEKVHKSIMVMGNICALNDYSKDDTTNRDRRNQKQIR